MPDDFVVREDATGASRWNAGRRGLQAARRKFLCKLTVRPQGVGAQEWLTAHGLSFADVGKDAAKAIGF